MYFIGENGIKTHIKAKVTRVPINHSIYVLYFTKPADACELHYNRNSSPHNLCIRSLPATNLKPKMMDIDLPTGYGRMMMPRFQYFAAKIYNPKTNCPVPKTVTL